MSEPDMEALNKLFGSTKAIEEFDKWQLLNLELRAIEFWDAHYRDNVKHDANEIHAFNARRVRKQEILSQIAKYNRSLRATSK